MRLNVHTQRDVRAILKKMMPSVLSSPGSPAKRGKASLDPYNSFWRINKIFRETDRSKSKTTKRSSVRLKPMKTATGHPSIEYREESALSPNTISKILYSVSARGKLWNKFSMTKNCSVPKFCPNRSP